MTTHTESATTSHTARLTAAGSFSQEDPMRAARDFRFATTLLVAALLCLPSQLMAVGQILDIHEPLGDFDTRVAVAGPTVGQ